MMWREYDVGIYGVEKDQVMYITLPGETFEEVLSTIQQEFPTAERVVLYTIWEKEEYEFEPIIPCDIRLI
jgi:hypothetical protein